jgi:hypothetical protein
MHDVQALIAKSDPLAAAAGRFERAVVCPLVQGFALLPITDDLAKELAARPGNNAPQRPKPLPELSDGLHALALEISRHAAVAYISTGYFGGQGGQNALVWRDGVLCFSPATPGYARSWPHTPISQALRAIGVVAEDGNDAFDTLGLGRHRDTQHWADSAR